MIYGGRALDGSGLGRWISVTADEAALARTGGLTAEVFPADRGLPGLCECCAPASGGALFRALEQAAQGQPGGSGWKLVSAQAEPVRYKPHSRCVIRYRLLLERAAPEAVFKRDVVVFGKIYSDLEQARKVQDQMVLLYEEQAREGQPIIPRPLGWVPALGIVLSEGIEAPVARRPLQPHYPHVIPETELRLTATALARLHTSAVRPVGPPRTGTKEAGRVRERAALLRAHCREHAQAVERIGNELARRLADLQPGAYRPVHGGFKPSQLLFHAGRVFVVDLDGFSLGDPALDTGYFLAYLRPTGLWYGRPGMRRWFEDAAACFLGAYRDALAGRGIGDGETSGILERSRFYEAALLFKIATRRVNRLNSPRPQELAAMLAEVVSLTEQPDYGHLLHHG